VRSSTRFINREDSEVARKAKSRPYTTSRFVWTRECRRNLSLRDRLTIPSHIRIESCSSRTSPVLVTGIQPGQVLGLERLFRAADAALLDPCDEHRDEGGEGAVPRRVHKL
jgi:hypothetical protein